MAEHTATPFRVVERVSQGINIEWGPEDGECRPVCHMRWSDGLNPLVEQAVVTDARFIVLACNHFEEMKETLKELRIGLKIRLAQEAASWGANADKTTEFLSKHPTLNKLEALLAKLEATE